MGVEVIALLCAGSVRYHEPLGKGGYGGQLTRAEVAGLLAGLSSEAVNFALAKYAGDLAAERAFIAQLRVWAAGLANAEAWQVVRGRPTVCNLCALAAFEVVRPNRCPRCQGRGMDKAKVCGVCNGSTFKPLSGRFIADAIGMDESSYRQTWKSRYERILRHVQEVDSNVNVIIYLATREKISCN